MIVNHFLLQYVLIFIHLPSYSLLSFYPFSPLHSILIYYLVLYFYASGTVLFTLQLSEVPLCVDIKDTYAIVGLSDGRVQVQYNRCHTNTDLLTYVILLSKFILARNIRS